jgi:hypothetical protein
MNDVLPTACAIRCICTALSAEWFVVLHGITTAILIHCVGARMSFVSKAHEIRELVYVHVHDVLSRGHSRTMVLSDVIPLSCRREP